MAERITVRLPEDVIRRAKRKAAAEGRTLTALIEDGLHRVLEDRAPARKKANRILPRVSEATGGLTPGIDLSDTAALEDLEDLEHALRLK
ncbi:MAG: DUF6364 family protein [Vitreimonas sp.]